ncbi:MAG: chemotaxis protein CheW [bacterium]|nr:MAG: chemotaxis protein CheW [bacterium]
MTETLSNVKDSKIVKKNKFITFFLDNEEYAVEIQKVREIIGIMDITPIPNIPDYIKGVLNLRGKVIPVIDLRLKFGMESKEYGDRTSIIVMEIDINNRRSSIGTVVDMVSEVLQISDEDFEETPSFGVDVNTNFIQGMAKVKGKVKILLDIEKVLTADDLGVLGNIDKVDESQTV